MAVAVVPLLEVVGVDEQQRQASGAGETRAVDERVEAAAERARRQQSGETVELRAAAVVLAVERDDVRRCCLIRERDEPFDGARVERLPRRRDEDARAACISC